MNMTDVIVPKSDQINADDLIGGPMTITIRRVDIKGGQEQPVSMYFDGSDKAFRPCKSMSRVFVSAWGPDAKGYVGRSVTLFRDGSVKWGGMEVGGIRISHMSDLKGPLTMPLTVTKGAKKLVTIKPLAAQPSTPQGGPAANNGRTEGDASTPTLAERVAKAQKAFLLAGTPDAATKFWEGKTLEPLRTDLEAMDPEGLLVQLTAAYDATQPKPEPSDVR